MAGLTTAGFVPATLEEIKTRIETRLKVLNPDFDFSPESPDGQIIEIMGFEIYIVWGELTKVYNSYDPLLATGSALDNLGLLTGLPRTFATKSSANVELTGVSGTLVPKGVIVTNSAFEEFTTTLDAVIPASVQAVASISGRANVEVGAINLIKTPVEGWVGVSQPNIGVEGQLSQSDPAYRAFRNKTVLRNYVSIAEVIQSNLLELGIGQVNILNNDSQNNPLADGTPANTIHVTVGQVGEVTDIEIAKSILKTKGLGCPTYGSTTIVVKDAQGHEHSISFSKAEPYDCFIELDITFLSEDIAGAEEGIRKDLVSFINSLESGEDVIISHLYGVITKYGSAQINSLKIGNSLVSLFPNNLLISADYFAYTEIGFIGISGV
jgi:uncharacterized phage protein gp47/JayE